MRLKKKLLFVIYFLKLNQSILQRQKTKLNKTS